MHNILENLIPKLKVKEKHIVGELLEEYYYQIIQEDLIDPSCEVFLPLDKRPSGIYKVLKEVIKYEKDINNEEKETPLTKALLNLDYYMIEYLIKHGANPNYWEEREEDIKEMHGLKPDNDYLLWLDHMILGDLDVSNKVINETFFKIAQTILEFEGVDSFYGCCFTADKEKRELSVHPLGLKY